MFVKTVFPSSLQKYKKVIENNLKPILISVSWNHISKRFSNDSSIKIFGVSWRLSIADIDCKLKSLKTAWIPRLLNSKGTLFDIFNNQCKKLNIDVHFLINCFIIKTEILNSIKLPLFYGEIFCCFNECNCELHYAKRASDDILQQLIWNNCKSLKIGINLEYYILKTCLTTRVISDE